MNKIFYSVVIFLFFPFLLFIMFYFPFKFTDLLALNIHNPSWWQFFTHSFVHKDTVHFWSNLTFYYLFLVPLYLLARKINYEEKSFKVFFAILLSVPIISSLFIVIIYPVILPHLATTQGSSGLVAAFLGYLIMMWIFFLSKRTKNKLLNSDFLILCFTIVAVLITIVYYPLHNSVPVILIAVGCLAYMCYKYRLHFKRIFVRIVHDEYKKDKQSYYLLFVIPTLFIIVPIAFFPLDIVRGYVFVDFISHYIGLILGLIISYIMLRTEI